MLTAPHSACMAARVSQSELVKAPGELVVSGYVTCPDITKVLTPDLKLAALGAPSARPPARIFHPLPLVPQRVHGAHTCRTLRQSIRKSE